MPIQKIQPSQLQAFYSAKLSSGRGDGKPGGLEPRTVQYLHTITHSPLKQAVKWQWVVCNVTDAVTPPRATRSQAKTWNLEEIRRFLAVAEADTYAPAWDIALATGLRRGELLGLRWQDIDLDRGTLHIRQSLVEIRSRLVFQEPKTKSGRRTVVPSDACVTLLRAHRTRQLEQRLLGSAWRDNDLVFTTADGGPVAPRNMVRRFKQLIAEADVSPIPFHGSRHTHATLLLRDGVHAKIVGERLGHSSTSITLDTYSHGLPDMQRQAITGIDKALFGKVKKSV